MVLKAMKSKVISNHRGGGHPVLMLTIHRGIGSAMVGGLMAMAVQGENATSDPSFFVFYRQDYI